MQESGRERAYQYLRGQLLQDPSLAGTFLSEASIAEEAGVSRTPVREAMLMLAGEDLVQLVPRRGAFVAPPSPTVIREVLGAREALETWATRMVLAGGAAPVAAMQACIDRQKHDLQGREGTDREFISIDSEFHMAMITATDNQMVQRMYEIARMRHLHIGVAAIQRYPRRRVEVIREHQAIVDALASRDEATALDAVTAHLQATHRSLLDQA
ncbi:MAG: GntR family transcriptional regulator [Sciscionella sp.]